MWYTTLMDNIINLATVFVACLFLGVAGVFVLFFFIRAIIWLWMGICEEFFPPQAVFTEYITPDPVPYDQLKPQIEEFILALAKRNPEALTDVYKICQKHLMGRGHISFLMYDGSVYYRLHEDK